MGNLWQIWMKLRSSLWLVPGIMLVLSIGMALVLVEVDTRIDPEWLSQFPTIFGLGADGSRGMLTAIGGSMLTVAALAFSLTLATIAQASSQYTPRILRLFLTDRLNQFVLGYFVSVFAYCLIVLRTIRSGDGEVTFVPSIAVVTGLLTALGGIVVLIYFIHHIADSLQVTNILYGVVNETLSSVERVFPEQLGKAAPEPERNEAQRHEKTGNWLKVPALDSGYIQTVNPDELCRFADENKLILKMRSGIGDFIVKDTEIVAIIFDHDNVAALDDDLIKRINSFYSIYHYRTIEQDVDFGIQQIVDVALKALSPGINDTTTAVNCIDYLGVILSSIAARRLPVSERVTDGKVRVIARIPCFDDYVQRAFDAIRSSANENYVIYVRMLESIALIYENTLLADRRAVLRVQVELIAQYAAQHLQAINEKQKVENKIKELSDKFYEVNRKIVV